jgi:hypothetical protein
MGDARLELDDAETDSEGVWPTPRRRALLPWGLAAAATLAAIVLGNIAFAGSPAPATAVWTSIPAPVSEFNRGIGPAVSPDGQRIAFVARELIT